MKMGLQSRSVNVSSVPMGAIKVGLLSRGTCSDFLEPTNDRKSGHGNN